MQKQKQQDIVTTAVALTNVEVGATALLEISGMNPVTDTVGGENVSKVMISRLLMDSVKQKLEAR